jgi:bifunctional UDP-N-acetylglucosamine pyrophosphorylase/glucosamine-1-phosphate N-acetyltransferase
MIGYVVDAAASLSPETLTIVVGRQVDEVRAALASRSTLTFVVQEPQRGTAHALLMAESALQDCSGTVVVLYGDVPLLSPATLRTLLDRHQSAHAAATLLTAIMERPQGYGRVVRSGGQIARIVEDRDASAAERQIQEINSGIYAFDLDGLFHALRSIAADNAQGEYYLPDLVGVYRQQGRCVASATVANPDEIRGINSRSELADVSRIVRRRKTDDLMASGVTIEDPATTYVDEGVQVGADTVIHPCVLLEGATTIGTGCEIHAGARIVDSQIGNRVTILNHCVITAATIADDVSVGPFAHLRPHAVLREGARVGNFVEVKNTDLGAGSKSMHLAYLGDATIGKNVNIGAGTITCNYDGVQKNRTVIEDGAFIGSDTQLVAPVTVGAGAYVGTGATIRENVPQGALAVSAGKQRNIEGWVAQKKKKG